ncbi:uncharacterized protein LOC111067462 [Drosophila obscura]|uniref:uncharacterized protein LOC111067462 n=1 Tax=Drosophila obscura TaxID=7282 RepID=UPI001BB2BA7B|nr:uncharacterized protein LOC111067462 [Drosophila obscura]
MSNSRSPFTRTQGTFGYLGSFNLNDQGDSGSDSGSPDKNGLNAMPFLNNIRTSPLLSRTMGRTVFPPMGDSDGFNAVPQIAAMGSQQPMGSTQWTGGARAMASNYYDRRYEGPYEEHYEGAYSMPNEMEQEPCSCQSQSPSSCQSPSSGPSQQDFSSADHNETDSETEELCSRRPDTVSRGELATGLLLSKLKPERRERLVASYKRWTETAVVRAMLLVLQLLGHVLLWLTTKTVGLTEVVGSVRLRLGNSKFKLRNTQRHLLWRMANARGHETLVFLTVALTTPWLFCLSLLGFTLSMMVLLKKTVEELIFQIRLRLLI